MKNKKLRKCKDYADAQIAKNRFNKSSTKIISARQLKEKFGV